MPVVAVGLSFKSAPLEVIESSTIPPEHFSHALHALVEKEHVSEAVVLSTCNRVEVYAEASDSDAGVRDIGGVFLEQCRADMTSVDDRLYAHHGTDAVRHLFRVAAGLDSMIVGESEILGQVRRAFQAAVGEGTAGELLSPVFRAALRTGKRARTETTLHRDRVSFPAAAAELIRQELRREKLDGARVVIVGAGKIGRITVRALLRAGAEPASVVVLSRSDERARGLAERWGLSHRPLDAVEDELHSADAIICCTAAPGAVIDRLLIQRVVAARGEARPLVIVDIAVPRDVDPAVREESGVAAYDIDDLEGLVSSARERERDQIEKAETIVAEELDQFRQARQSAEVAPVISSLLASAEAIRESEVARVRTRLSSTDEETVNQLTKRIVANLLHAPIAVAKESAASGAGNGYAAALRELFRLRY